MILYYREIPIFKNCMGSGRMPPKYWIIMRNWKKILSKLVKFEEVYIYYKKEKLYYLTSNY